MSFPLVNPTPQFFDNNGDPLVGGTIEFRSPTTNALINSYPTADDADAQTNANDNPLTLNARGEAANGLYLEEGVSYKVILKDSAGATIWNQDDVKTPAASVTIVDGSVTASSFDATIQPVGIVTSVPGALSTRNIFNTTDGRLYYWDGSAYVRTIPTTDLSGTIDLASQISGALTAAFADAGLINSNVTINADGSLSGAGSGQASLNSLPGTIQLSSYAASQRPVIIVATLPTLPDANYPTGATVVLTTDGKLYRNNAGTWTTAVPTSDLSGTITAGQIAANTITAGQIAAGTITAAEIAALTITAAQIAANTITANEIAAGTITAAEIAALTITAAQIAANTITANEIAAGTITAAEIASNAITADKILAGEVSAAKLATTLLYAGDITLDTSGSIKSGQTAYDTGTGFYLGNDAGTSKFSIGDADKYMTWDGTGLTVQGTFNGVNSHNLSPDPQIQTESAWTLSGATYQAAGGSGGSGCIRIARIYTGSVTGTAVSVARRGPVFDATVVAGQLLKIRGRFKVASKSFSGTTTPVMKLRISDFDGTNVVDENITVGASFSGGAVSGDWIDFTATHTVADTSTVPRYVQLYASISASVGVGEFVYLDLDLFDVTTVGDADTVQASDIGVTVQGYDADTMKSDVNKVVTAEWSVPSIPRNKTANYTMVLGDAGQTVRMTGSTAAQTITIPANASVAYPIGTLICIENDSSASWSLAITTDTLTWSKDNTTGTRTLAAGASCVIHKTTATTWKISGSALVT